MLALKTRRVARNEWLRRFPLEFCLPVLTQRFAIGPQYCTEWNTIGQ
jgi:hypothetical protein